METVPSGTPLTVTLADAISTETNKEGNTFTAHLTDPIIVNGKVVAEKGDRISGHIKTIEEPGRVKGRARLVVLDQITTSNHMYKLSTEPFIAVGGSSTDRDAGMIAGGAGVDAVIGAIAGGGKGAAHCQNHSSSSASGVFNPSKNRSKRAPTPPPIRNH